MANKSKDRTRATAMSFEETGSESDEEGRFHGFTRSIWTFCATGKRPAKSSTHARITAGVAFAGMGFWALISRIAASCCFD
jgi:hypothetical protein